MYRERAQEELDEHIAGQDEADRWWQALCDADEATVLVRLETAFRAHAMPATPVAVTDRTAHLVIPVDTPERLIGKREPTRTARGDLSLALMPKTRRHDLYVQAIGSAVLAVAAETFAVVPGVETVSIAIIAPGHPSGPSVIALSELDRQVVLPDGHDRPAVQDLTLAGEAGHIRLVLERVGQARAPRPLPDDDPAVAMVLDVLEID